jgi:hypothetical protein
VLERLGFVEAGSTRSLVGPGGWADLRPDLVLEPSSGAGTEGTKNFLEILDNSE